MFAQKKKIDVNESHKNILGAGAGSWNGTTYWKSKVGIVLKFSTFTFLAVMSADINVQDKSSCRAQRSPSGSCNKKT